MGILLALTALFAWALGDFLIQRSARKFGDWLALFYVTAFGAIVPAWTRKNYQAGVYS